MYKILENIFYYIEYKLYMQYNNTNMWPIFIKEILENSEELYHARQTVNSEIISYRKSHLMGKVAFDIAIVFSEAFDREQLQQKREYNRNIKYLFWVKNAFLPLTLLTRLSRVYHCLNTSSELRPFLDQGKVIFH